MEIILNLIFPLYYHPLKDFHKFENIFENIFISYVVFHLITLHYLPKLFPSLPNSPGTTLWQIWMYVSIYIFKRNSKFVLAQRVRIFLRPFIHVTKLFFIKILLICDFLCRAWVFFVLYQFQCKFLTLEKKMVSILKEKK